MNMMIGIIIAVIGFLLICVYLPIDYKVLLFGKNPYIQLTDIPLQYAWLLRLCTYGIMMIATYMFFTLVPKKQLFFTEIGNATMVIYLLHMALVRIFYDSSLNGYIAESNQYWILIIISLSIVYLLSRKPVVAFVNKLSIKK